MVKIVATEQDKEIVLLDTENIKLGGTSEYYKKLSSYDKLDEALQTMSSMDLTDKENWRIAILLQNLKKKKADSEEPEINSLIQQCKDFSLINTPNSEQLASMKKLSCYRVGADAGAGFKEGDLDVLGTEGFLHCTGVLIATEDENGTPCYYIAHVFGDRTTKSTVEEELNRILSDVKKLTGRKLSWSDLKDQVTLVGPGSDVEEPSLGYKQIFKILTQAKANPLPLFADSVAFNLTGLGDDLIILDPKGQLNEGTQSQIPRVGHGVYSPVDNISDAESITTIEKQISDAILAGEFPYKSSSVVSKL
ncbi:Uncharacterised protein [Legionella steigerwaltii]|uniref:Uncharacterized protein n=1 Tax=Legionella steigerwaltii TaxID=460 RepID=A0A378LEE4_9GAMM|nr:hypothetical protein [Legionella steigerwaltii]KTD78503.1 hypothetical protein Lstg_1238 [Legionella steigerwaltii]STY24139.1 Uncharacterised protein [Legionella steigerwaltii]